MVDLYLSRGCKRAEARNGSLAPPLGLARGGLTQGRKQGHLGARGVAVHDPLATAAITAKRGKRVVLYTTEIYLIRQIFLAVEKLLLTT